MAESNASEGRRSPVAAFFLNALLAPAGYVYVGRTLQGLAIYAVLIVLAVGVFLLSAQFPPGIYALSGRPGLGQIVVLAIAPVGLGLHAAWLSRVSRPRLRGAAFWAALIGLPLAAYGLSLSAAQVWPYPIYSIPSESGVPTLLNGDVVLAHGSKTVCGRITPQRGDIVVYRKGSLSYIKRLIGLPGETISIEGGVPKIGGQAVVQASEGSTSLAMPGFTMKAEVVRETLPNGKSYRVAVADRTGRAENMAPVKLGSGEYFFLGDSRDNSLDSRFDGPAPAERLCAVATKIVASMDKYRVGLPL